MTSTTGKDQRRIRGVKVDRLREQRVAPRVAGWDASVVPPSQEAIRAAIESQVCPWCGKGPFAMLPVHTNKMHAVDKYELRDLAGYTTSTPMVSSDTRAKMRERWEGLPPEERRDRASRARAANDRTGERRWTRAGKAKLGEHMLQWAQENPEAMAALRAGFRERMESPEAQEKWRESMKRAQAKRAESMTNEEREAFKARMSSPDIVEKRRASREASMTTSCSVDGCDRPHAAKGLCRMHWRRLHTNGDVGTTLAIDPADAARKGRPGRRSLTDEQMDEVRALCHGGMSQRQVAERFGVTQSLVSRVVRGDYRQASRPGTLPW